MITLDPTPVVILTPISDDAPVTLNCPDCGGPRLRMFSNRQEVIGSKYFLSDGDTVDGFFESLCAAGIEDAEHFERTENTDHELLIGECPHCGQRYTAIDASLINAEVDQDWIDTYFLGHQGDAGRGPASNFQATMGDSTWLTSEYKTPKGTMQTHMFGPFPSPEIDHGYRFRPGEFEFAKTLLVKHWPALKAAAAGGAYIQPPIDFDDTIDALAKLATDPS